MRETANIICSIQYIIIRTKHPSLLILLNDVIYKIWFLTENDNHVIISRAENQYYTKDVSIKYRICTCRSIS